jgi:hypothetical protein
VTPRASGALATVAVLALAGCLNHDTISRGFVYDLHRDEPCTVSIQVLNDMGLSVAERTFGVECPELDGLHVGDSWPPRKP